MKQSRTCNGFSLIEMMITVALFALLAGLVIAQSSYMNRALVATEIDRLYATCMYAQQCALVSNQEQSITFDKQTNSYSYQQTTHQLPHQLHFGCVPGAMGPPSTPTKPITSAITFINDCITVYPHGIIGSGTIYLTDASNQSMYALSCAVSTVSHLRVYRYDGAWHLLA